MRKAPGLAWCSLGSCWTRFSVLQLECQHRWAVGANDLGGLARWFSRELCAAVLRRAQFSRGLPEGLENGQRQPGQQTGHCLRPCPCPARVRAPDRRQQVDQADVEKGYRRDGE